MAYHWGMFTVRKSMQDCGASGMVFVRFHWVVSNRFFAYLCHLDPSAAEICGLRDFGWKVSQSLAITL
jgi:hypothetical protein